MGTTADKLNKVLETKEAIRTAINNKGGTLTETDKFSDYATAIDNIQSGGGDNPLQYVIDNKGGDGKPSCEFLFYKYLGSSLDDVITNINTSNVTDMSSMFYECKKLTSIPQFDTSACTKMSYMFNYCEALTSIPQFDTSKVTNMENMFYRCFRLTSIPQLDTSACTKMSYMFNYCGALTSIPQLDTSKVTSMTGMFSSCSNLTAIPQLDTSNVTDMRTMFYECYKLTSVPQLNISKVTGVSEMFSSCTSLVTIPQLDTIKVTSFNSMFRNCYVLPTIDLTYMNVTSINSFSGVAYNCYSLTKFIIRNMPTIPALNSDAFTNCYHFYGTTNETYNPDGLKDGRIYVPYEKVEELKTATNWSVFADIIMAIDFVDGEHVSQLHIDNSKLKLNTPRKAKIYLNEFTNIPTVDITVSNESIAQINNTNITTEKITFDINALGTEGNATITVNITGDYNKTLTTEVSYTAQMQYTVEKVDGATYGFELNANDYYESTNKRKSNSYSLCKLVFNITEKFKALKLECINSGENGYDYGILSNIDTTLTLSSNTDSTNVYKSFNNQSSTTPVVITYPEATVGEHFIYIKYRKDGSGDTGNDSLQFKVIS